MIMDIVVCAQNTDGLHGLLRLHVLLLHVYKKSLQSQNALISMPKHD